MVATHRQFWIPHLLLAAFLFAAPKAAHADPVQITTGSLNLYWDNCCGSFGMTGPGFEMGVVAGLNTGPNLSTWQVGTTVDPNFTYSGGGYGFAIIEGVRLPADAFGFVHFSGNLQFDTTPFVVHDLGPNAQFVTPFSMTGSLSGYDSPGTGGQLLFTVLLAGQGTSSTGPMLRFETADGVSYVPVRANQSFRFEEVPDPVPEPTSILLLGTGLLGMALRRSRRRFGTFVKQAK